jgi:hypothetical protein
MKLPYQEEMVDDTGGFNYPDKKICEACLSKCYTLRTRITSDKKYLKHGE